MKVNGRTDSYGGFCHFEAPCRDLLASPASAALARSSTRGTATRSGQPSQELPRSVLFVLQKGAGRRNVKKRHNAESICGMKDLKGDMEEPTDRRNDPYFCGRFTRSAHSKSLPTGSNSPTQLLADIRHFRPTVR